MVATVYEHRRVADERLDAVLESAGFTLPRDRVTDLRTRFVARYGLDLAETIERVAEHHAKVIPAPLNRGSDPFRSAIVWAIAFECLTRQTFREGHGITAAWEDLPCGSATRPTSRHTTARWTPPQRGGHRGWP